MLFITAKQQAHAGFCKKVRLEPEQQMEVAEHRPRWQLHEMASLLVVKIDHTFPQEDNLAHSFADGSNLLIREVPPAAHVDDELVDEALLAIIKEMAKRINEFAEQRLH